MSRRALGALSELPNGRYRARFTAPDGTRRHLGTYPTRRAAEIALAQTAADTARGEWLDPETQTETLGQYAARYLDRRHDLAPATMANYRDHLARFVNQPASATGYGPKGLILGEQPLGKITVSMIADWHAAIITDAKKRIAKRQRSKPTATPAQLARAWAISQGMAVAKTGRLSPAVFAAWQTAGAPLPPDPAATPTATGRTTGAHAYRFARLVLGAAKREGLIRANPADVPGAGATHPTERTPITPAQVAAIAANMPARYAAAITLAAWGALRAGEVFGLERRHVTITHDPFGQVAGAVIRVEQALTHVIGQPAQIGPPKTRGSRRTVHLPATAARELADHLNRFTAPHPGALVFTTESGELVTNATRQQFFGKARLAVDRPDLRFHDLRHTGATLATMAGAGIKDVMRRLGHTTPRAALIYQHTTDDTDRLVAAKLEALANGAPPTVGQPWANPMGWAA
ncbi:MAG: site-specific integrase [Promicromonosporaceae bacterium]|nr:site-specific integrase [Promicromonosporaceae bacterium]